MDKSEMLRHLWGDIRRLRAFEGYIRAGLPNFPGLFGRDSLITAWQLLPYTPGIARATLKKLAKLQGERVDLKREEEPGKILHEYYEPWQFGVRFFLKPFVTFWWGQPYYGSVDATFLWMIVLAEYVKHTNDRATLDSLRNNVVKAVRWIQGFADHNHDGFFDYMQNNKLALKHQAWKDSDELGEIVEPVAPIEVQGYAYAALLETAQLLINSHSDLAKWAMERAEALKRGFRNAFVLSEYFAFALDGDGNKVPWVTSNPSHLLFSGILEKADEQRIIKMVFSEKMWTPYGMRTLSLDDRRFDAHSYHRGSIWPHDNWFLWMGLRARGYADEAEHVKEAMLRAYDALGGRICELFSVDPKGNTVSRDIFVGESRTRQKVGDPQAWASGTLLSMLS